LPLKLNGVPEALGALELAEESAKTTIVAK
jgi:hypothetical protein